MKIVKTTTGEKLKISKFENFQLIMEFSIFVKISCTLLLEKQLELEYTKIEDFAWKSALTIIILKHNCKCGGVSDFGAMTVFCHPRRRRSQVDAGWWLWRGGTGNGWWTLCIPPKTIQLWVYGGYAIRAMRGWRWSIRRKTRTTWCQRNLKPEENWIEERNYNSRCSWLRLP